MFVRAGEALDPASERRYLPLVEERAARCPLQHLTGTQDFWRHEFLVTPDVLVPRPETELLVEHALAALRANCHVMVEKPFTTDAKTAREVVALAKKKRRHVVVPYGWHYRPLGVAAKELMRGNPLGRIEFVACHMASPLKNLIAGKSFDFTDGAYVAANLSTWTDPALSRGATRIPASPITSGSEEALDEITGAPHAIASNGVSPKPS